MARYEVAIPLTRILKSMRHKFNHQKRRHYDLIKNYKGEWRRYMIMHAAMICTSEETYTTRSEWIRKQISSDYFGK